MIDALHESRCRSPVLPEGESVPGALLRFQVGKDIGAAEPVDGLLGITHDEENGRGARHLDRRFVDTREDPGLQRIGVLILVDQGNRIAFAHAAGESHAVSPLQGVMEFVQKVLVAKAPGLPDQFRPDAAHPLENVLPDAPDDTGIDGMDPVTCRFETLEGIDERALGKGLVLQQGAFEPGPAEPAGATGFPQSVIVTIEKGVPDTRQPLQGPLLGVGRPPENVPLRQHRHEVVAMVLPQPACFTKSRLPLRFAIPGRRHVLRHAVDFKAGLQGHARRPLGQ